MSNIVIKFNDGTEAVFEHVGRAGGSYTKKIRYEGNFAIITDEWYNEHVFPCDRIKEIKVSPNRSW